MQRHSGLAIASFLSVLPYTARAHEFLTADQDAWPASVLVIRSPDPNTSVLWQRTLPTRCDLADLDSIVPI
jgi:hypothetical protein